VDRVDRATRVLDALDHLELHFQGAHQSIEVRNDDVVGLAGLHHLDRPQQSRPPGERKLAAYVDLLEHLHDAVALVLAPQLGLGELGLGRVEVLVFAVSVLAYPHDDDVSVLLLHAGSSTPGWTLAPYGRLGPDRREGTRG